MGSKHYEMFGFITFKNFSVCLYCVHFTTSESCLCNHKKMFQGLIQWGNNSHLGMRIALALQPEAQKAAGPVCNGIHPVLSGWIWLLKWRKRRKSFKFCLKIFFLRVPPPSNNAPTIGYPRYRNVMLFPFSSKVNLLVYLFHLVQLLSLACHLRSDTKVM